MKILLVCLVHSQSTKRWYQSIADAAFEGLEVVPFGIMPDPPGSRLTWLQLNALWQRKDPGLMRMYERLQAAAADCDVLLHYNGAHIHPEMLQYLGTFNVFCCFDDPEASAGLSQPVADAFDAVFYGNIASRFQYESWGCAKHAWLPMFVSPKEISTPDQGKTLFIRDRNNDIIIGCDRNPYRCDRLDQLAQAFPQAIGYGQGWSNGWIETDRLNEVYRRTRIGWNVHNSTGPINQRLFMLPACGVMQICDNKTGLGHIFDLGKEVVGFDRIDEAIDATRYYLDHESERVEMAIRGHLRFQRDYHPTRVWERIVQQLRHWGVSDQPGCRPVRITLPKRTRLESFRYTLGDAKRAVVQSLWPNKTVATPPKPIDERAYLAPGNDSQNDQCGPPTVRECRHLESTRINTDAVAWAITALLGNAETVGIVGSRDWTLAHWVALDPSRSVYRIDQPGQAASMTNQQCDTAIWLDGLNHADRLPDIASHLSRQARHAILVVPNQTTANGQSPQSVHDTLTKYFNNVQLYHMPKADIPWLEPLTPQGRGNPIIACCNHSNAIEQRKAA